MYKAITCLQALNKPQATPAESQAFDTIIELIHHINTATKDAATN